MKDKLTKHNRKPIVIKARKFFVGSIIVGSLFAAIAIPTYISTNKTVGNASYAQDPEDPEVVEEDVEEDDLEHYE